MSGTEGARSPFAKRLRIPLGFVIRLLIFEFWPVLAGHFLDQALRIAGHEETFVAPTNSFASADRPSRLWQYIHVPAAGRLVNDDYRSRRWCEFERI